jgi:hypothetical protein
MLGSSTDHRFAGSVWLVRGQLFSISFDKPTEHVLDEKPVDLIVSLREPKPVRTPAPGSSGSRR